MFQIEMLHKFGSSNGIPEKIKKSLLTNSRRKA
jgi:hypothetical protein